MKTALLRISLRAALLAATIFCIGWADNWDDLKKATGQVSSVSAEFTQQKHMQILARPLESRGTFKFQAPDSLRWEYHHPLRSVLITHGGRTKRFVQTGTELVEDASANLQSMQTVVHEITRWLNGHFDENPAFSARLAPGPIIILTPKEESISRLIQHIEIALADQPAVIQSVLIFESADSFTRLDFNHVILNQPIDESVFREGP